MVVHAGGKRTNLHIISYISIIAFLHIVSPLQGYDTWYMLAWTMLQWMASGYNSTVQITYSIVR